MRPGTRSLSEEARGMGNGKLHGISFKLCDPVVMLPKKIPMGNNHWIATLTRYIHVMAKRSVTEQARIQM